MQPWQCYLLIFGIVAVSSAFFYVLFEDPFGCHTESVTERRRREVKDKLEYGYPVGIHIDIGSYNSFNHSMSTLPVSDSFGGWDLQIRLTNKSSRTILRVDTVLTPHAINGDVARSSIGGKSTCMASADGPICSGDFRSYIFQKPWYDINLAWVEVEKVIVTYDDGTKEEYDYSLPAFNWTEYKDRMVSEQEEANLRREEEKRRKKELRLGRWNRVKPVCLKLVKIVAPVVLSGIVLFTVLTKVLIPNHKYNAAVSLINEGYIIDGYESLIALNGYKDSVAKASEFFGQYITNKMKITKVGDTVFLGSYEQDNNTKNGKESIEWIILDKKDDKAFLISKYALDCQEYNTSYTDVTWETCSLRKWMNGTFLNNAFSAEEQALIQSTTVSADKNPNYSKNPGNATTDKVFLLSIAEAEKYFSSDSARQCKPTKYAVANGAYVNSNNGNCWWWLRSPGYYQYNAADVYIGGSVDYYGSYVDHGRGCVRPALWISLEG